MSKRLPFATVVAIAGALVLSQVSGAQAPTQNPPAATPPALSATNAGHQHAAPYAVGLRSYTFVDTSRATPPNGSFPGMPTRTLPTLLVYPAKGDPAGSAVENAPPVERGKGFPLLVFSHGSGGSSMSRFVELTERLVREGFVVAAPTFPLSSADAPGGPTGVDNVNQPGDVSFVITQVLALARDDRTIGKTVDRHEIGAIGNSLGAVTTLGVATNSCCLDPRIDAAVSLWGAEFPFPNGSFFSEPTPPLMLVHGTADERLPYGGSVIAYEHAPSPKAFLTLEEAPHNPFFPPWHDPMIRSVIDFLDGFLDHDPQALRRLPRDGNVTGVASLQEDLSSCPWCGGPPQRSVTPDTPPPTSQDQCTNGGWQTYSVFKNQGDCVSFVATGGKNPPAR
jgi:dienelactone hydrolase